MKTRSLAKGGAGRGGGLCGSGLEARQSPRRPPRRELRCPVSRPVPPRRGGRGRWARASAGRSSPVAALLPRARRPPGGLGPARTPAHAVPSRQKRHFSNAGADAPPTPRPHPSSPNLTRPWISFGSGREAGGEGAGGGVVCLEMLPFGVWGGFNAFSFFFFFSGVCGGGDPYLLLFTSHRAPRRRIKPPPELSNRAKAG